MVINLKIKYMKINELRYRNWITSKSSSVPFEVYIGDLEPIFDNPEHYFGIPLTEEWLLKFGFENWGKGKQCSNEFETYDRFVLHNALDGTSNFEVHNVISTYGGTYFQQYIISCDEDDRLNWGSDIKYVHQLQNLYFALTQQELTIT